MRRLPFLVCALTLLAAPAPAAAAAAGGPTGGAAAPSSASDSGSAHKARRALRRSPIAREFTVAPATLEAGRAATFTFRIDGPPRKVRVRIELARVGATAPVRRLRLGDERTGVRHEHVWTPVAGELLAGDYTATLRAIDDTVGRPRRRARATARRQLTVTVPPPPVAATGVFPVQGAYSFGGEDARFGAGRDGHIHQGQDVAAAEGTPLVAPLASTVTWVAYQAAGAGHYVVLRGADGRDYVFMHIKAGTITVVKGVPLAAGRQFAQVGSTGGSTGPHLHFEIWPDGWYSSPESKPIDPLPQLQAWAAAR
jgi:murein DD-endopeptidase MepM/ murein hydrolase activator NlpD